jgi:hypothetical protein
MKKTRHLMSYLAGIFDGEGCVSINKKKLRPGQVTNQFEVTLQMQMCDEAVPRLYQAIFGGSLMKCPPRKDRPNSRPVWHWNLSSKKCLPIMQDLLPYVILKRPQLEVAIHFLENRKKRTDITTGHFVPISAEEYALREADYILCHKMKGRIEA